jgi:hypothetical protein
MIMRIASHTAAITATLTGALLFSAAAPASQQAFHRAYSGNAGDHLYTTSVAEIASAAVLGYAYEGVACNLVTGDDPLASAPLYRAYSPGQADHFYTANFSELINAISALGYQYEGVSGYITATGSDFLRSYSGSLGDHFYTTNFQEWINSAVTHGYTLEGSAGKVL